MEGLLAHLQLSEAPQSPSSYQSQVHVSQDTEGQEGGLKCCVCCQCISRWILVDF